MRGSGRFTWNTPDRRWSCERGASFRLYHRNLRGGGGRAACERLLSGETLSHVSVMTPRGVRADLAVEMMEISETTGEVGRPFASDAAAVTCAVRKDAGDDPDVTDKALIQVSVSFGPPAGENESRAYVYESGSTGLHRLSVRRNRRGAGDEAGAFLPGGKTRHQSGAAGDDFPADRGLPAADSRAEAGGLGDTVDFRLRLRARGGTPGAQDI